MCTWNVPGIPSTEPLSVTVTSGSDAVPVQMFSFQLLRVVLM